MKKIHFLLSHPIQYHSPLFDQFAKNPHVELKVYYCSDYGLSEKGERHHPELGILPTWDIDLVGGYPNEFLKNNSPRPSIFKGFWGLINLEIYTALKRDKPDVLIINGWNYFSVIWAIICCKIIGIPIYVRGDNILENDEKLSFFKRKIKHIIYKKILFNVYDKICFVGELNKLFFIQYGVPIKKLIWTPHAVDNKRFRDYYLFNKSEKVKLRNTLAIKNIFTILFVGRLHDIKRPLDLIKAVASIKTPAQIIFIGDGLLREKIISYCKEVNFKNYFITGFLNQKEILKYYLIGDVMVLPSESETWGLVVNEAMNFNLPIIVSDKVGCGPNLCTKSNGFIFQKGNISSLTNKINSLIDNRELCIEMGNESGKIIEQYSYDSIIKNILASLN
ncbi:MAG: glycosyltransferase family 4 protein [Saprospiraceae bacterium]